MLNIPPSHQSPLLAALAELDEVAYLLADAQLNIIYLSARIGDFGIGSQSTGQPLASACPELEEKRAELESVFASQGRLVLPLRGGPQGAALAQASGCRIEGQNVLLVLFRRCGAHAMRTHDSGQTLFDPLTGLYTPLSMSRRIEEEISRMKRYQEKFSLLLLKFPDVERERLSQVADLLRIHLRVMDIVGNYKDGQFLAILPETSLESAKLAADRLRAALHDANLGAGAEIRLIYHAAEAAGDDSVNALLDRLDSDYPGAGAA